jgi:hypothetical protein
MSKRRSPRSQYEMAGVYAVYLAQAIRAAKMTPKDIEVLNNGLVNIKIALKNEGN